MHRPAAGGPEAERDPEPARVAPHLRGEGTLDRRGGVGVAEHGTARRVEEGGTVTYRPGERVFDGEAAEHVAVTGAERVAGPGRFEPEQAAT
jgi:hypothetical protein